MDADVYYNEEEFVKMEKAKPTQAEEIAELKAQVAKWVEAQQGDGRSAEREIAGLKSQVASLRATLQTERERVSALEAECGKQANRILALEHRSSNVEERKRIDELEAQTWRASGQFHLYRARPWPPPLNSHEPRGGIATNRALSNSALISTFVGVTRESLPRLSSSYVALQAASQAASQAHIYQKATPNTGLI